MASTTDYDAPRSPIAGDDSLEELQARRASTQSATVDIDELDLAESFELPGAEQLDEELTMTVVPMQADEFRCSRCFLVQHRNQRASADSTVCRDCS
jgi:hypothetical protein